MTKVLIDRDKFLTDITTRLGMRGEEIVIAVLDQATLPDARCEHELSLGSAASCTNCNPCSCPKCKQDSPKKEQAHQFSTNRECSTCVNCGLVRKSGEFLFQGDSSDICKPKPKTVELPDYLMLDFDVNAQLEELTRAANKVIDYLRSKEEDIGKSAR